MAASISADPWALAEPEAVADEVADSLAVGAALPDAVADWPLLNAMTAVSSGATWVSLHHGGGVGMGRSIHAGQVTVADGTELAAAKLRAVLTNDPGMGVIRHVDSGYTRAKEVADERGVRIPMEFKARD